MVFRKSSSIPKATARASHPEVATPQRYEKKAEIGSKLSQPSNTRAGYRGVAKPQRNETKTETEGKLPQSSHTRASYRGAAKSLKRDETKVETACKPSQPSDFDVDYVISYCYDHPYLQDDQAGANFAKLIQALGRAGLCTTVREGADSKLLVFIKANKRRLVEEVYYSRVKDWLFGICTTTPTARPETSTLASIPNIPLDELERLINVYYLITQPTGNGGAGITPKQGEWQAIDSIFPLHNQTFNRSWVTKNQTRKSILSKEDLTTIKDQFGSKLILIFLLTAYDFSFLQSYFMFLLVPAAFGSLVWLIGLQFQVKIFLPLYAVSNCLSCVAFTEYYSYQERCLAETWGVLGAGAWKSKKHDWKPDDMVEKSVTERVFKWFKQILFWLLIVVVLGVVIAFCFSVEVLLEGVYEGSGKSMVVFLPMGLLMVLMPLFRAPLSKVTDYFTKLDDHKTPRAVETALSQKTFIIDFLTSVLPILFTASIYLPFGSVIAPYFDILSPTCQLDLLSPELKEAWCVSLKKEIPVDPERLQHQIFWLILNSILIRLIKGSVTTFFTRGKTPFQEEPGNGLNDSSEASFLARVRAEAELNEYNPDTQFQEICMQFSHLAPFSYACPWIAPLFLISNWRRELCNDATKLCSEMKRPIPWRIDSIGPWLDHLSFLAWFGCMTTTAFIWFSNNPNPNLLNCEETTCLIRTLCFTDLLYITIQFLICLILGRIESSSQEKERAENFAARKRVLDQLFEDVLAVDDDITKMEMKLVQEGNGGNSDERERFWVWQRASNEAIRTGAAIISKRRSLEVKVEEKLV